MLANLLTSKVQLQQKTATQGALGQTVTWEPVQTIYARVVPLNVNALAQYQQLNTVVTHRIVLRGEVDIDLGEYRLLHGSKTYEPQVSAKHFKADSTTLTEVIVKEV